MSAAAERPDNPEPTLEQQVAAMIDESGEIDRDLADRRLPEGEPSQERPEEQEQPGEQPPARAEGEEPDQGDEQPGDEAEDEPAEEESDDPAAAEATGIETLAQLAEAFEVPEAELTSHLRVSMGDQEVPLAKVLEIARTPIEDRVAAEADRRVQDRVKDYEERSQKLDEVRTGLEKATAQLLDSVQDEFKEIDWNALRENDPQEYLIQRQRFEDRRAQANEALARLNEENERRAAEEDRVRRDWAENERAQLLKLPEFAHWAEDPKQAQQEIQALGNHLVETYGLDPEIVAELVDHRLVRIAHRAMLYDKLQAKKKLAVEKVRKAPKMMPPGARTPKPDPNRKRQAEARDRMRRTGDVEDAAAFLLTSGVLDE